MPLPSAAAVRRLERKGITGGRANTFTLTYKQDKKYKVPTEIFLHKPVESIETDGKYEIEKIDDEISVLKLKTGIGDHTITIKFEGEGFSYMDHMEGLE